MPMSKSSKWFPILLPILTIGPVTRGQAQEAKTARFPLPATKEELLGELSAETSIPGPAMVKRNWKEFLKDPNPVQREPDYFVDSGSLRFAVRAKQGKRWVLVFSGKEKGVFNGVESISVSPGGQHVVYSAKRESKWVKIVDDRDLGPAFDELGGASWFWGESGPEHYAYAAKRGKTWLMIADGKDGPEYEEVGAPHFSSDGLHLAYKSKLAGSRERLVVDGKPGPEFDEVGAPQFSPCGQHLAYSAKIAKKRELIILDRRRGRSSRRSGLPSSALTATTWLRQQAAGKGG